MWKQLHKVLEISDATKGNNGLHDKEERRERVEHIKECLWENKEVDDGDNEGGMEKVKIVPTGSGTEESQMEIFGTKWNNSGM